MRHFRNLTPQSGERRSDYYKIEHHFLDRPRRFEPEGDSAEAAAFSEVFRVTFSAALGGVTFSPTLSVTVSMFSGSLVGLLSG